MPHTHFLTTQPTSSPDYERCGWVGGKDMKMCKEVRRKERPTRQEEGAAWTVPPTPTLGERIFPIGPLPVMADPADTAPYPDDKLEGQAERVMALLNADRTAFVCGNVFLSQFMPRYSAVIWTLRHVGEHIIEGRVCRQHAQPHRVYEFRHVAECPCEKG